MIAAYTTIKSLAQAIRDNTDLENSVVEAYGKGLLVQIDDNPANPIGAEQAPFCVLYRVPQTLMGTIAEDDAFGLLVVCGVVTNAAATADGTPYEVTTARSATANGLTQWSNPEAAENLLVSVVEILKEVNLGNIMISEIDSDVDGGSYLPLQTASAQLLVIQKRTLNTW